MRRIILMMMILSLTINAFANVYGEIKGVIIIECEIGVAVFLDGRKVGVTTNEITELTTKNNFGVHTLEVQKSGCKSQKFSVDVKSSEVEYVKVAQVDIDTHINNPPRE